MFPCFLLVFDLFPSRDVLLVVMASRLVTCSIGVEATLVSVSRTGQTPLLTFTDFLFSLGNKLIREQCVEMYWRRS